MMFVRQNGKQRPIIDAYSKEKSIMADFYEMNDEFISRLFFFYPNRKVLRLNCWWTRFVRCGKLIHVEQMTGYKPTR